MRIYKFTIDKISLVKWATFITICLIFHQSKGAIHYWSINDTIRFGQRYELDINQDSEVDYIFFIDTLPPIGFLYCKVNAPKDLLLDKSQLGFVDALNENDPIAGSWTFDGGLLGSISGGEFIGKDHKYLGLLHLEEVGDSAYSYLGWVCLSLSEDRSVLIIHGAAFCDQRGQSLNAGQTIMNGVNDPEIKKEIKVTAFDKKIELKRVEYPSDLIEVSIYSITGALIYQNHLEEILDVPMQVSGYYLIVCRGKERYKTAKVYVPD